MKRFQLLFVLGLAVTGCATSSEEVADEASDVSERVCVSANMITSFDAIDDRHLYIRASGNRHYLFTLSGGCLGLPSAQTIAVKDTFSRVCSNSFGEIVYRDMGRRFESCKIRDIEAVASKDDAEGLVEDRKKARQRERADDGT